MSFSRSSSFQILRWDSSVPSSHRMSPMLTSAPAVLVSLCFLDTPDLGSTPVWGLCLGYALRLECSFPTWQCGLLPHIIRSSLQGSPHPIKHVPAWLPTLLSRSAGRVSPSALRSAVHLRVLYIICTLYTVHPLSSHTGTQRWHLVFT